jgi:tRNA (Thr-GGU) A37 N-methylase
MGVKKLDESWVLWWFDRNDNPRMRSTLRVHLRGNPANPLTGMFATRSPMRPNLIGVSRCRILSIKDNVLEIQDIDALPDTPVLDLKR